MNICAVCAHTDDAEIYCAGTLAMYSKRGDAVSIIDVFDGRCGYSGAKPPENLSAMRRDEGLAAARLINATRTFLGVPDESFDLTAEQKMGLISAIRKAQPNVIFTHHPEDQNPDHRLVSRLVRDCGFYAAIPGVNAVGEALPTIVPIFYVDTAAGLNFQPTDYVDIGTTLETKKKMFLEHKSQIGFLAKDKGETKGTDYTEFIELNARYRGHQAGVRHAEGFIPLIAQMGIRTYPLLP